MPRMIFAAGGKSPFIGLQTHLFRHPVFRVDPMRLRFTGAALVAAVTMALAFSAGAGAELIGVYRNPMESTAQRADAVKLSGESCARGGSEHAFRIVIGKRTEECSYRTPVIGRDLEISATLRLLSKTPEALRKKSFLALTLRAGGGAHYQLAVFPLQRKAQLRKTFEDGTVTFLRIAKNLRAAKGVNKANKLRLRAFNVTSGPDKGDCRLLGYVGNQLVAEYTDHAAGDLQGRASGFAVGATTNAKGAVGSVDDVVVRVPSPF